MAVLKDKVNVKKYIKGSLWNSVGFWTAFASACALLAGAFARLQLNRYEQGVVEIYAVQQDAYVQLVLDQINLNREQEDEGVIIDIIGTLDNSTNKYWTLSHEETLLFVKDVTETNRYKGFTTSTYYISDSAREFIDLLNVNKVRHRLISIGEKEYIASGAVFEYQGVTYQICLLTNPEAVLDHNVYLGAKINLTVMICLLLALFVITIIALAKVCSRRAAKLKEEQASNQELSRMVEQLNEIISQAEAYDARLTAFRMDQLPLVVKKLSQRVLYPITMMRLEYTAREAAEFLLEDSILVLDKQILRFRDDENGILVLVAIRYEEKAAVEAVKWLLYKEINLTAVASCDGTGETTLEEALRVVS